MWIDSSTKANKRRGFYLVDDSGTINYVPCLDIPK
jgi:hypothetical protein